MEKRFEVNAHAGITGVAGQSRYAVLALGLIVCIELSPVDFLVSGSFLGKTVSLLLVAPGSS
jgi:hypothetical protein